MSLMSVFSSRTSLLLLSIHLLVVEFHHDLGNKLGKISDKILSKNHNLGTLVGV
jgi:hypothetical protein